MPYLIKLYISILLFEKVAWFYICSSSSLVSLNLPFSTVTSQEKA